MAAAAGGINFEFLLDDNFAARAAAAGNEDAAAVLAQDGAPAAGAPAVPAAVAEAATTDHGSKVVKAFQSVVRTPYLHALRAAV